MNPAQAAGRVMSRSPQGMTYVQLQQVEISKTRFTEAHVDIAADGSIVGIELFGDFSTPPGFEEVIND
jgi:hypothetical protein